MSKEIADVGVIVGRFQVHSLHEAHVELIQSVCKLHPKVLIFLGLAPIVGTKNNPLDFESRKQMILEQFKEVNVLYIKDTEDDALWSKRLDEQIQDLITPGQTVMLYGGRDSFIKHYTGKHKTQELEPTRIISGSEVRKTISKKMKASEDFRAGIIWLSHNQYPRVYPTVDVAILDEKQEKVLLARKPNNPLYQFIGGFADPKSASYEEDIRREAQEEAQIEIGDIQYIGSYLIDDWRYKGEVDKIKTSFFTAKYIFGSPCASDDICELMWFDFRATFAHEKIAALHQGLFFAFLMHMKVPFTSRILNDTGIAKLALNI